ncbi:hypothetical protein K440DRAFT_633521 [Wilcoxina mikolae CBS 423.85]|nr:hypothetical protein K440DRAFT_633521 [Wilcoxina mikolae CBS 423.85]
MWRTLPSRAIETSLTTMYLAFIHQQSTIWSISEREHAHINIQIPFDEKQQSVSALQLQALPSMSTKTSLTQKPSFESSILKPLSFPEPSPHGGSQNFSDPKKKPLFLTPTGLPQISITESYTHTGDGRWSRVLQKKTRTEKERNKERKKTKERKEYLGYSAAGGLQKFI